MNIQDYQERRKELREKAKKIKFRKNWLDDCIVILCTSSTINFLYIVFTSSSLEEILGELSLAISLLFLSVFCYASRYFYQKKQEKQLRCEFCHYAELYVDEPGSVGWLWNGEALFFPPDEILKKLQK